MNPQRNAVLEKGKPGVIRGRKANGSASADGRVADRENGLLTPISGNRGGFFYALPAEKKDSRTKKCQVGGGTFNPG
jgi:hypothetical protein